MYEWLQTPCTCSAVALEMAAEKIGPSFIYDLYVRPKDVLEVRTMLKCFGADTKEHPLSPYINLHIDEALKSDMDWYLWANGKTVGSYYGH